MLGLLNLVEILKPNCFRYKLFYFGYNYYNNIFSVWTLLTFVCYESCKYSSSLITMPRPAFCYQTPPHICKLLIKKYTRNYKNYSILAKTQSAAGNLHRIQQFHVNDITIHRIMKSFLGFRENCI